MGERLSKMECGAGKSYFYATFVNLNRRRLGHCACRILPGSRSPEADREPGRPRRLAASPARAADSDDKEARNGQHCSKSEPNRSRT